MIVVKWSGMASSAKTSAAAWAVPVCDNVEHKVLSAAAWGQDCGCVQPAPLLLMANALHRMRGNSSDPSAVRDVLPLRVFPHSLPPVVF